MSAAGAGLGLLVAAGLILGAWWWSDRRPLPLVERIGPFVGRPGHRRRHGGDPTVTPRSLLARVRPSAGPGGGLRARIDRSGDPGDVSVFRLRRIRWSALGGSAGLLVAVGLGATSRVPIVLLLAVSGGSAGWWLCEAALRRSVRRRQRTMAAQFPMVADLVALAVSAGASPVDALGVAADAFPGPLSDEIRAAVEHATAGASTSDALAVMVQRIDLPEVRRLVDALILATELGTPVGEVARAQAADVRAQARRRWMESAGRKDVAMLVPIVFLVLPGVVAVALFPGLQTLRVVVP